MSLELAQKLRLTAAALGCVALKELAREFRRVNPTASTPYASAIPVGFAAMHRIRDRCRGGHNPPMHASSVASFPKLPLPKTPNSARW